MDMGSSKAEMAPRGMCTAPLRMYRTCTGAVAEITPPVKTSSGCITRGKTWDRPRRIGVAKATIIGGTTAGIKAGTARGDMETKDRLAAGSTESSNRTKIRGSMVGVGMTTWVLEGASTMTGSIEEVGAEGDPAVVDPEAVLGMILDGETRDEGTKNQYRFDISISDLKMLWKDSY